MNDHSKIEIIIKNARLRAAITTKKENIKNLLTDY